MYSPTKDLYNFYQLEAQAMHDGRHDATNFWLIMLQASGIFVTITFIVFFIANYQFIKSQLVEWRSRKAGQEEEIIEDGNSNGLPDWWEKQYSLNLNDPQGPFLDKDGDGVNNLIEYEYNTNPLDPDTDRDQYFDGEEIRKGYDPNGIGRLDKDKDKIYDWWEDQNGLDKKNPADAQEDWDTDGLINRDEFIYLTDPLNADSDNDGTSDSQEVAIGTDPMGIAASPPVAVVEEKDRDTDQDQLKDYFETLYGTDLNNKDTDQDGFDDYKELSRGFDPTGAGKVAGEISLPSINIKAPIIWSESEDTKAINADLEKGIIHYPTSAFPGMRGNSYITGHSSYYAWSKSPYKEILKSIGNIKEGDKIILQLSLQNGRKIEIVYRVRSSRVVMPDNEELFRDYEGYEMTLVSCWPIGTDWKRMMVKADLETPKPE